jgi:dTDP-4-amino-4,6-dideoxygalactose transaminase
VPIRLPPVRQPAPLRQIGLPQAREAFETLFPGRALHLVGSGTQALALAILACRSERRTQASEVIVPAYGCPDLLSACIFAGMTPRLVDIDRDHWGYDREQLQRSVSRQTVGVLAVNLLGIGDDHAELQRFADAHSIGLIADSAQHVPTGDDAAAPHYTVLSFGRGKPVNALRGGMLIAREPVIDSLFAAPTAAVAPAFQAVANLPRPGKSMDQSLLGPVHETRPRSALDEWLRELALGSRLAALAFNLATHPRLYGLTSRLPGLGVGTTTYRPLTSIRALPASAWRQVGAALAQYRAEPTDNLRAWRAAFGEWRQYDLTLLHAASGPASGRHLRLPLLARDRAHRDRLVDALHATGLGASRFYGAPLQQIAGVPEMVACQGPFPNASRLADRLLTLPTHAYVTEAIAQRVTAIFRISSRA